MVSEKQLAESRAKQELIRSDIKKLEQQPPSRGRDINLDRKKRVLANLERRFGALTSLKEKAEAGIVGEGADPEFVKLKGAKLQAEIERTGQDIPIGTSAVEAAKIPDKPVIPTETQVISQRIASQVQPLQRKTLETKSRVTRIAAPSQVDLPELQRDISRLAVAAARPRISEKFKELAEERRKEEEERLFKLGGPLEEFKTELITVPTAGGLAEVGFKVTPKAQTTLKGKILGFLGLGKDEIQELGLRPRDLKEAELKEAPPPPEGAIIPIQKLKRTFETKEIEAIRAGKEGIGFGAGARVLGTVDTRQEITELATTGLVSAGIVATAVAVGIPSSILLLAGGAATAVVVTKIENIQKTESDPAIAKQKVDREVANFIAAVVGGGAGAKIGGGVRIAVPKVKAKIRKIKFERAEKRTLARIPKFTVEETRARLRLGGIETVKPGEIQTTFDTSPQVVPADVAARARVFAKTKGIKGAVRPEPPTKIVVQETAGPQKIVFLEKIGDKLPPPFRQAQLKFQSIRARLFDIVSARFSAPGTQAKLPVEKPTIINIRRQPILRPSEIKAARPKPTELRQEVLTEEVQRVIKQRFEEPFPRETFKQRFEELEAEQLAKARPKEKAKIKQPESIAIKEDISIAERIREKEVQIQEQEPTIIQIQEPEVIQEPAIDIAREVITIPEAKTRIRAGERQPQIQEPIFQEITAPIEEAIEEQEIVTIPITATDKIVIQDQREIKIPEVVVEEEPIRPSGITSFGLDIGGVSKAPGEFQGYQAEVLEKRKFRKVSPGPQTRRAALDRASEVADKTINATFRARKIKTKKQPLDDTTGYFASNRFKFRDFRADIQGQRVTDLPPDTYIEKRKFRLDDPKEKRTIDKFLEASRMINRNLKALDKRESKRSSKSNLRLRGLLGI